VRLDDTSEPEPDIAIPRPRARFSNRNGSVAAHAGLNCVAIDAGLRRGPDLFILAFLTGNDVQSNRREPQVYGRALLAT
jgi:hypothetical protein